VCRNPFLAEDALAALMRTTREGAFRQLRLGQWVAQAEGWRPWGACADAGRVVSPGERVVLGFDGSASGDSTVLIGCTVEDPHLFVVDIWPTTATRAGVCHVARWTPLSTTPSTAGTSWAADPWGWRSEIEAWAKRHGEQRVLEFNTGAAARMGPATDRLYQAVMTGTVTHDGDKRLASHIANTVAKSTTHGDLVTKDRRNSPRKIDAAVGAIIAHDRAAAAANTVKRRYSAAGF
jgi:hypothetical protein